MKPYPFALKQFRWDSGDSALDVLCLLKSHAFLYFVYFMGLMRMLVVRTFVFHTVKRLSNGQWSPISPSCWTVAVEVIWKVISSSYMENAPSTVTLGQFIAKLILNLNQF